MSPPAAPKAPEPASVEYIEIGPDRAGQRLDNFLSARLKGVPRSLVYRILRTGQVRVNGKRAKPDYKLQAGDAVRIPPVSRRAPPVVDGARLEEVRSRLREAVLFENDDFMVLNKPAGMAVHGGSGLQYGLIEALKAGGPRYAEVELVHRLDRGTSGCLLLARHRGALRELHALLRERRMEKTYTALLKGRLTAPVETRAALSRRSSGGDRMVGVAAGGKPAVTRVEPKRWFAGATMVTVAIDTGRTHQIRVHCTELGHPLAGDEKYGDRGFNRALRERGLKRLFLHAAELRFTLDQTYVFNAPLPAALSEVLEKLDER